jgi:hypothetical protein
LITGFETLFKGHEKLTQLGQKKIKRVLTKEKLAIKLAAVIAINPKSDIKLYSA